MNWGSTRVSSTVCFNRVVHRPSTCRCVHVLCMPGIALHVHLFFGFRSTRLAAFFAHQLQDLKNHKQHSRPLVIKQHQLGVEGRDQLAWSAPSTGNEMMREQNSIDLSAYSPLQSTPRNLSGRYFRYAAWLLRHS